MTVPDETASEQNSKTVHGEDALQTWTAPGNLWHCASCLAEKPSRLLLNDVLVVLHVFQQVGVCRQAGQSSGKALMDSLDHRCRPHHVLDYAAAIHNISTKQQLAESSTAIPDRRTP